jgi:hypothetical protein
MGMPMRRRRLSSRLPARSGDFREWRPQVAVDPVGRPVRLSRVIDFVIASGSVAAQHRGRLAMRAAAARVTGTAARTSAAGTWAVGVTRQSRRTAPTPGGRLAGLR